MDAAQRAEIAAFTPPAAASAQYAESLKHNTAAGVIARPDPAINPGTLPH
jgi:hypothetical protein